MTGIIPQYGKMSLPALFIFAGLLNSVPIVLCATHWKSGSFSKPCRWCGTEGIWRSLPICLNPYTLFSSKNSLLYFQRITELDGSTPHDNVVGESRDTTVDDGSTVKYGIMSESRKKDKAIKEHTKYVMCDPSNFKIQPKEIGLFSTNDHLFMSGLDIILKKSDIESQEIPYMERLCKKELSPKNGWHFYKHNNLYPVSRLLGDHRHFYNNTFLHSATILPNTDKLKY